MFDNLEFLPAKMRKIKGKTKERDMIEMVGAERLAHLDAIIKLAQHAREKTIKELDKQAIDYLMVKLGKEDKKPATFVGVEGDGEVNITTKKRSINSPLSEEELDILARANIPVKKEILTPALFAINPDYATDMRLLAEVKRSLHGIVPKDFFVKQQLTHKYVISEESLEAVFKKPTRVLLRIATVLQFSSMVVIPSQGVTPSITTRFINRLVTTLKQVLLGKRSEK